MMDNNDLTVDYVDALLLWPFRIHVVLFAN